MSARRPTAEDFARAREWAERELEYPGNKPADAAARCLAYLLAVEPKLRAVATYAKPLAGPHRKKLTAALDELDAFDSDSDSAAGGDGGEGG